MSTLRILTALLAGLITASDAFAQAAIGSQLAGPQRTQEQRRQQRKTRSGRPPRYCVTIALDASAPEVSSRRWTCSKRRPAVRRTTSGFLPSMPS